MAAPVIPPETRLQMAALIAAVRTARMEGKDFQGMTTPRMACAISESIFLADRLCKRAIEQHPEWFHTTD